MFHFNVLGPSLRFIFVISLPCSHGLRSDGMTFVLELQTARQFFLAIRTGFNFIFLLDGNTGRLNWQTSSYLQIFSSGMISNFLKLLSTAFRYLWSSPREQLQLERSRLAEDHQLQTEFVKKSHSDFWLRWNSEKDFKEKLQASRPKILNKDLTLEELRFLYEKQHLWYSKFRFELRVFDLRSPQLQDQRRVVLQDSLLRSRL